VSRGRAWSLRARITALLLPVTVLLTLFAVGGALAAADNSRQIDVLFNQIGRMRTDAQQLEVAILNQETGIRGYAVGGTDADLQPYTEGLAQQQALVTDIKSLVGDRPQVRAALDAALSATSDWQTNVAQPVIADVRAGNRPGALALIDPSARQQFDTVRNRLADLDTQMDALRSASRSDVQRSSRFISWMLVGAIVVIVVGGLVLALLLRRLVGDPVSRLAADVRRVAGGDYERTVDTTGPPEIVALGADVDEMRRRIVADLQVVRTANESAESAKARLEQANETLERQTADLRRSNQDLEQFAYVASHDLQEPLRKVASFCQLLQRRYAGQLDERADQYISFAVDGAHRMQRLINDLLAFSRIGRVSNEFTDVDLGEVVAAATAANDEALARTRAEVVYDGLPTVRGEEPLLTALFANLIGNSAKFRRPDRSPRIEISASRAGEEWEVVCRDNGIGIEAEYADKVFVIFQRLHPRDTYPGTGIGLAVAKRIVEHHGGRIWVDTGATDGTSIHFTIPNGPRGSQ
jgi:signal transduction histidine kinase